MVFAPYFAASGKEVTLNHKIHEHGVRGATFFSPCNFPAMTLLSGFANILRVFCFHTLGVLGLLSLLVASPINLHDTQITPRPPLVSALAASSGVKVTLSPYWCHYICYISYLQQHHKS